MYLKWSEQETKINIHRHMNELEKKNDDDNENVFVAVSSPLIVMVLMVRGLTLSHPGSAGVNLKSPGTFEASL
ncbi:hypothetical protein XELAEV_18004511mg [Xenopus laevis]|uniref:Uncharacterized protein n=1 Tax=Xenopus laevis TaxID=8355 RepID=A0A974GYP0_XENLA|nr:hypothetical protein XELAEV_18004511mg [Xenopus laevis]